MATPLEETVEFLTAINDPGIAAEIERMNQKHETKPRKGKEDRRQERRFKNTIKGFNHLK